MLNKYEGKNLEDLVLMAQQGDQLAEEHVIRSYNSIIKSKANRYYIVGADGQDVVQEAMIGLFKAIKNYSLDKEASFNTFADLCMNRQIISAVKAANRNKHIPLNSSVSIHRPIDDQAGQTYEDIISNRENTNPDTILLLNDIVRYINENNEKIFSELETMVWNDFANGKSYEEISKDIEKPIKSVYNAMERAKKKILDYLAD